MSGLALLAFGGFAAVCLWGIAIGVRGALADSPPYMQGVGQTVRTRLAKSA